MILWLLRDQLLYQTNQKGALKILINVNSKLRYDFMVAKRPATLSNEPKGCYTILFMVR